MSNGRKTSTETQTRCPWLYVRCLQQGCHAVSQSRAKLVLGMDQPIIYAIGKFIQWKWWDTEFSEDHYVLLLGALHIEFVLEAIEGKSTEDGSMAVLVMACKAGILTAGRVQSFSSQPEHYLKWTRYTHQVSLLTVTFLKNKAYTVYQAQEGLCDQTQWEEDMKEMSNMFAYWSMLMNLELLHCHFVRSCARVILSSMSK